MGEDGFQKSDLLYRKRGLGKGHDNEGDVKAPKL